MAREVRLLLSAAAIAAFTFEIASHAAVGIR
jgi:hypothetical protein